jgi:HTH-type transcriptional regulator/antitoxin MqsA
MTPSLPEELTAKIRARRDLPSPSSRRQIRQAAGLTQMDIARAIGVCRPVVARWESGERRPNAEHAQRYLELLDSIALQLAGKEGR